VTNNCSFTELFESDRCAIAVTQYDKSWDDESDIDDDGDSDDDGTSLNNDACLNDEAKRDDIKRMVCKQLEDTLEVPIPHDLIFVVSGMWALKARILNCSNPKLLRDYLKSCSRKVTSSIGAPGYDTAQRLLAVSGIGVLERRSDITLLVGEKLCRVI